MHFFIGVVHDDLKVFLEANIPTGKKKSKVALGISDSKIGGGIQEDCNIQVEFGPTVTEILRGVRYHFHKMIQGIFPIIHFLSVKLVFQYLDCSSVNSGLHLAMLT